PNHPQQHQMFVTGSSRQRAAKDIVDILNEISILLHTRMDRTTLSLCVSLIENGVNPEALAASLRNYRIDWSSF
ncbi:hypothetical protein K440DRAFT_559301, partial [Wilcoxina mikolae CBS 423.85]